MPLGNSFSNSAFSYGLGDKIVTGRTVFVDSGNTRSATVTDGLRNKPFSTIEAAFNSSFVAADNGDVIIVMPGHTESISAAGGLTMDKAGVSVIGLGNGTNRPTITTTNTAGTVAVTANNVSIENMIFTHTVTTVAGILVTGTNCRIEGCRFQETTGTPENYIMLGAADGDANGCRILNNECFSATAGNQDEFIGILFDMDNVLIEGNWVDGDFDEACIEVPTAGDNYANLIIRNNYLRNRLSGNHAIQLAVTNGDGAVYNNQVYTDALGTSIAQGASARFGNTWTDGTASHVEFDNGNMLAIQGTVDINEASDEVFEVTGGSIVVTGLALVATIINGTTTGLLESLHVAGTTEFLDSETAEVAIDGAFGDTVGDIMRIPHLGEPVAVEAATGLQAESTLAVVAAGVWDITTDAGATNSFCSMVMTYVSLGGVVTTN